MPIVDVSASLSRRRTRCLWRICRRDLTSDCRVLFAVISDRGGKRLDRIVARPEARLTQYLIDNRFERVNLQKLPCQAFAHADADAVSRAAA